MRYALKRLSLGVVLILLASSVLLGLDIAQQRKPEGTKRVAILQHSSTPVLDDGVRGMTDALKEAGFQEGVNLTLAKFNAEGDLTTGAAIARQVTSGQYDLVLTSSTPSMIAVATANKAGKTVQVFGLVADPFGSNVGLDSKAPLSHPPSMVGQGCLLPVRESFDILRRCLPSIKRIGIAWNPGEMNSRIFTGKAKDLAPQMGMEVLEASVENSAGVVEAVQSLISRDAQVIWVGGDNTMIGAMQTVIDLAKRNGIPVVSITPGKPDRGTLFELGLNFYEVGKMAGELAARVLKGADTRKIPIEDVAKRVSHKLHVNRLMLKGLKEPWSIPDDLAKEATAVVDETGVHTKEEKK